jgi:hypothetical protein
VQIDFETPMLEGSFEGVLIAKTGTEPSLRLQLFPDVGPKVLDLTATSEFIACDSEDADPFYCPLPSEERIPPSLPFLFAVTLLEHFATLDPTRVVGVRDWEEGHELELTPHSSGVEVRIFLRHDGSIAGRWFRYGRIRWRETAGNPLELEARGVHVVLETITEEIESEIDSSLFRPPPAVQP